MARIYYECRTFPDYRTIGKGNYNVPVLVINKEEGGFVTLTAEDARNIVNGICDISPYYESIHDYNTYPYYNDYIESTT